MRHITGFEIVQALREVNYPWAKGAWFKDLHSGITSPEDAKDHKSSAACIMSQLGVELGVDVRSLVGAINEETYDERKGMGVADEITSYNDESAQDLEDVRKFALDLLMKVKGKSFELPEATYFIKSE